MIKVFLKNGTILEGNECTTLTKDFIILQTIKSQITIAMSEVSYIKETKED